LCCVALGGKESDTSNAPTTTTTTTNVVPSDDQTNTLYDDMCKDFKLPIDYLDTSKQIELSEIVATDLEFKTIDPSSNPMYHYLFDPTDEFSRVISEKWHNKYTADIGFLMDSQKVITNMKDYVSTSAMIDDPPPTDAQLEKVWKATKHNPHFLEIYSYMEWEQFEFLNHSSFFLQAVSLANISAPILALIIPVLFLLVPFLIMKIQGIPITFTSYMAILQDIAKHHFIGKAILSLKNMTIQNVLYFLAMAGLYFYQIYQNTLACIRFYNNISKINESLYVIKQHISTSVRNMERFYNVQQGVTTPEYRAFLGDIVKQVHILKEFLGKLGSIQKFQPSVFKISEVGYLLECFYQLHHNKQYESALQFSFGFSGYLQNVQQVYLKYQRGVIGQATYLMEPLEIREAGSIDASGNQSEDVVKYTSLSIDQQYYPPYVDTDHVKNNILFDKNMVITGPNAAGKTTIIKTTLINIIMSQQVGFGFFAGCQIQPYSHIYSYLNIPDTSGRDSLFQAESRRCRDILVEIEKDPVGRHFCIFDELYSGTNPTEAVKSAGSFLKFLTKFANVDFILTTHYTALCKKLKKFNGRVQNYKMEALVVDDKIKYTYRLKKGISYIEGAKYILKDMNYPKEIYGDESNR